MANERRVVWLILDGVTHWIVERLWAEGRLPHLKALAEAGTFRATRPVGPNCETPVQLATLFTGRRSIEHGVLGYHMPLDDDPFRTRSGFEPDGLRIEPLWRTALAAGRTVALTHIAFADVARDARHEHCRLYVDGYGQTRGNTFVVPQSEKASWVERVGRFAGNGNIGAYLRGRLGRRFQDGAAEDAYLASLHECADYFARGIYETLDRFPAELTFLYFPCTDEIGHAVLHYLRDEEPDEKRHSAAWRMLTEIYEKADALVGGIRERLAPDDALVVCSDHGVAGIHRRLHVNRLLADAGYCAFDGAGRLRRQSGRVFLSPANHGLLQCANGATDDDVEAVVTLLRAVVDDETQMPPIERVTSPGDRFRVEAGVRFLQAAQGYELSAADAQTAITKSGMRGHHQSGADRPALRGVLFAPAGASVPESPVPNTEIRAVVERLLRL